MEQKFVFISYSSKEYSEATKVCIHLEANGIKCWMAPRNIQPGESYASQIVKAIQNCSALVLLASKETNESGHVTNEVSIAFDKRKTIIPFRIEDFTFTDEFIYFLGRKHWINAFEGFEKGLNLLTETLKTDLDINSEPTPEVNVDPKPIPDINIDPEPDDDQTHPNNPGPDPTSEKKHKFCTSCGAKMDISLPVCTNCGKAFPKEHHTKQYKFCTNCGSQMDSVLPFCTNCGQAFNDSNKNYYSNGVVNGDTKLNTIQIIIIVLLVLASIGSAFAFFFIPLLWCIPMTIHYSNKCKKNEQVSTAFKICTILFMGLIPGILMFFDQDTK